MVLGRPGQRRRLDNLDFASHGFAFCVRARLARIERAMNASVGFAAFDKHKYLCLETFKKSGEGVRTPIWFAADPASGLASLSAKLYVYTIANTGKVKRLRNNPRVRIAPCDYRGKILGAWVDAQARAVTGEEAARGMRLLNSKYFPLKQILGFFAFFSRRERVVFAIRPA
jgi:PPOX class probable F420-dependent enzyme